MRTDPIGQPLEDLSEYIEKNRTELSVTVPDLINRIDNLLLAMNIKEMKIGTVEGINVGYAYTSYNPEVKFEKVDGGNL